MGHRILGLQTLIRFGNPMELCHIKIKRKGWLVGEDGMLKIRLLRRLMLKEESRKLDYGFRDIRIH